MKKLLSLTSLAALALLLCSGCASVINQSDRDVRINSNPTGASITVVDGKGKPVVSGKTPTTLRLARGRGYFVGANYTVKFELPGYYPSEVEIHPHLSGWYFGNVIAGGAIGLFAVDPLVGGMWELSPNSIDRNLIPTSQALSPEQLKAADAAANAPPRKVARAASPKG